MRKLIVASLAVMCIIICNSVIRNLYIMTFHQPNSKGIITVNDNRYVLYCYVT